MTGPAPRARAVLMVTTVASTLRAFLLPFAAHFRAAGWRVDALAAGAPDDAACVAAFDRVHDSRWTRSPYRLLRNLRGMRTFRAVVRAGDYDVVHVHTPVAAFFGRLGLAGIARSQRPRVVYTAHGFHFHEERSVLGNWMFRTAERIARRWTDHLVVINDDDLAAARAHHLVPRDGVTLIRGIGIDLRRYDPTAVPDDAVSALRTDLGLSAGDRVVLMVAELVPRKGHATALEAFARLDRDDVHLVLAGAGPEERRVRARAQATRVADRVHVLGLRDDVPALLRVADVTLLPSVQEGMPRVILESMSMGVPVVGSRIRGIRDLVGDDECGILCPVGDSGAVATAIATLLDDPGRAAALGGRGRERVTAFTLDRVLDAYDQLYREAQ
jgi:glycosyltransferase involved in cell wall biosynthesis